MQQYAIKCSGMRSNATVRDQMQIHNNSIWSQHNQKFQIGTFNYSATISPLELLNIGTWSNLPGFLSQHRVKNVNKWADIVDNHMVGERKVIANIWE